MYDHGKYHKIDKYIANHDVVMFPTSKDYEQLPKSIINMAGDEEKFLSCQHPHDRRVLSYPIQFPRKRIL